MDKKEVQNFLDIVSEEIHKPAKRKFPRQKVEAWERNEIWSADLVDMSDLAKQNEGYKYILNVVDVFSRRAFAVPMKTKTATETLQAFKAIAQEVGFPKYIWVDRGKEFYNKEVEKWMKDNKINMYSTYGISKSAIVERFNRTLKTNMWKEFTRNNNRDWINIMDDLMTDYNNRIHSSIKMTPLQKWDEKSTPRPKNKGFPEKRKTKFKLGDRVRISRTKGIFEKGYYPNWSQEVYDITGIIIPNDETQPETYILKDTLGEELKGSFYKEELQKTKAPQLALVEKVLKERKKGKKKEYLVKWLGYSDSFNSWVSEDDISEKINS